MKILFVTDPHASLSEPFAGGTEAFAAHLAGSLVARGHSVDIVAKDADERQPFQLIEFEDSPYSMKDKTHSEYTGQRLYRLFQYGLMSVADYDIVHYHSFTPELFQMGALHSRPAFVSLHIPPNDELKTAYELYEKRHHPQFVAVSERMKTQWHHALSPRHMTTIPNGISIENWPMQQRNPDGHLLWSGRINAHKNPKDAIALAQKANKKLIITGTISDDTYFANEVQPYLSDTITYAGHVSQQQVNQLANGACAYVATAVWQEPFGLSTLEMLASGLPVIGYESAIAPEFRTAPCVRTGEAANPAALLQLIQNLPPVSSQECRAFAATFSMEKCTDLYEAAYQKELDNA